MRIATILAGAVRGNYYHRKHRGSDVVFVAEARFTLLPCALPAQYLMECFP
jgi:hypothetical protein